MAVAFYVRRLTFRKPNVGWRNWECFEYFAIDTLINRLSGLL